MRNINRKKFYKSDGLNVTLSLPGSHTEINGFVTDLSPVGVAIVLDQVDQGDLRTKHCVIDLSIKGKGNIKLCGCIVSDTHDEKTRGRRLGIVLIDQTTVREPRKHPRLLVNTYFPATLSCKHPFLYKNEIYFRIIDVSSHGMGLITSLSNKFIYRGMMFESNLHLPKVGSFETNIQIRNVLLKGDHLYVNSSFDDRGHVVQSAICKYLLLSDTSYTPSILKRYGFTPIDSPATLFDYAELTDFVGICNLRHQCYGAANPVVAALSPTDLLDPLDETSRHLVYRANGSIAASARVIFNHGLKQKTEIWSKYNIEFEDVSYWDSFVEVSKFCVSPSYQKTDLAINLVTQVIKIAYETDHKYIICTCEKKLYQYYKRMGFTDIASPFDLAEHETTLYPIRASIDDLLQNSFASSLRKYLNNES